VLVGLTDGPDERIQVLHVLTTDRVELEVEPLVPVAVFLLARGESRLEGYRGEVLFAERIDLFQIVMVVLHAEAFGLLHDVVVGVSDDEVVLGGLSIHYALTQ